MKTAVLHYNMPVILKKSSRAKQVRFKIRQGNVILTVPQLGCVTKAFNFLDNHKEAVSHTLRKQYKVSYEPDSKILILGKEYTIRHSGRLRGGIQFSENEIIVNGYQITAKKRLKTFLATILKKRASELALKFSEKIGADFNNIIIRMMSERWASCTNGGNLLFSTKLLFSPEWVFEYVVAHEICHLKEFNHSPRFWALVESIYPEWREARRWLKDEGKYIL